MQRPWVAEREVAIELARELILEQFPELAPAGIELLGVGWDNSAYVVQAGSAEGDDAGGTAGGDAVGQEWVFRFPRRTLAVDLLRHEVAVLPRIAPSLPLAVPVPLKVGEPSERFPWPWAGYRRIVGQTACRADLDLEQRARAAVPIARFLAALHAVPDPDRLGAPRDEIGRLDLAKRTHQIRERLDQAARGGLVDDPARWEPVFAGAPAGWTPRGDALVHGDFYARHLVVDDAGRPAGVIDWGDVHAGDPAIDLSIAHGFLPPPARAEFRAAYGPVDDATWRMARFKALHSAVMILVYGHDVADGALEHEGRFALDNLLA